jgi:hypothetical protein
MLRSCASWASSCPAPGINPTRPRSAPDSCCRPRDSGRGALFWPLTGVVFVLTGVALGGPILLVSRLGVRREVRGAGRLSRVGRVPSGHGWCAAWSLCWSPVYAIQRRGDDPGLPRREHYRVIQRDRVSAARGNPPRVQPFVLVDLGSLGGSMSIANPSTARCWRRATSSPLVRSDSSSMPEVIMLCVCVCVDCPRRRRSGRGRVAGHPGQLAGQ